MEKLLLGISLAVIESQPHLDEFSFVLMSSDGSSPWGNNDSSIISSVESSPYEVQNRGQLKLFRSPGPQMPGTQVDLPDILGCLHSTLRARARTLSYAVSTSL